MKDVIKGLMISAAAIAVGAFAGYLYNKAPDIATFLEDQQNSSLEIVTPKVHKKSFNASVSTSGVLIRPDLVLTVGGDILDFIFQPDINVQFKDGTTRKATVYKVDDRTRLMLLKISPVVFPTVNVGEPVMNGDTVTLTGHAFGDNFFVKEGQVVGFRKMPNSRSNGTFMVNTKSMTGMRGGPVFDKNNNFVGLINFSSVYCHCIGLEEISLFLEEIE